MKKIAIVEGDGIGHEVIPVARQVLGVLHPEYDFYTVDVGYHRWEETGCPCADRDIAALKEADAVLFGAVTTPPMRITRASCCGYEKPLTCMQTCAQSGTAVLVL